MPFLDIDNRGAFAAATRLLIDLGHRHIALLNGDCRQNFATDRLAGFRQAMQGKGIAVDRQLLCEAEMHEETAYHQASRLLALSQPPTALLCSSIGQALGVRRAAGERGMTIGRDIALIAHDDRLHELRAESVRPAADNHAVVDRRCRQACRRTGDRHAAGAGAAIAAGGLAGRPGGARLDAATGGGCLGPFQLCWKQLP